MGLASIDALKDPFEDADGARVNTWVIASPYTFRLASNETPPLPTTWRAIPRGAFPINPPTAPTTGATVVPASGALPLVAGQYRWALGYSTRWGDTVAGPELVYTTTADGYGRFTFPAVPSIADNPVTAINIYRSTRGGASGTKGLVGRITDMAAVPATWTDGVADTLIGAAPPGGDTSGISAAVTVTGPLAAGGSGAWAQAAHRSGVTVGTEQFAVDYAYPDGGTLYFAATDVGKSVTITYTASIMVEAGFGRSIIDALQEVGTHFVVFARNVSTGAFPVPSYNTPYTLYLNSLHALGGFIWDAPTGGLAVPADGTYLISLRTSWTNSAGTIPLARGVQVHVNGATVFDVYETAFDTSISGIGTQHQTVEAQSIEELVAGDSITPHVFYGATANGANPSSTQTILAGAVLFVIRIG
jgi:hypothetical protein